VDREGAALYSSAIMANQTPPRACPVCKVAMQSKPDDPTLEYDIFVCGNCSTSVLIHHPTPDSEDED
jgi:hypothetical protein